MKRFLAAGSSGGFRLGLPVGIALIVVTNLVVLVGVVRNRLGEPIGRMTLSERELNLRRAYQYENSGISLSLDWDHGRNWQGYEWLTAEKLASLGFDLSVDPNSEEAEEFYRHPLPIEGWVAMEFDGPAWSRHLASLREAVKRRDASRSDSWSLKQAESALAVARAMGSRLVVIDAELDADALRERYPDGGRYLILRAEIGIRRLGDGSDRTIVGYVSSPLITFLHVPRPYSRRLDSLDDTDDRASGPRYEVVVAVGRRFEPWVESVRMIDARP